MPKIGLPVAMALLSTPGMRLPSRRNIFGSLSVTFAKSGTGIVAAVAELAVAEPAPATVVRDRRLRRREFALRHVPRLGGGGHEHGARGGTEAAVVVVVHRRTQRAAGELTAVLRLVAVRLFDGHLRPVDVELLADDHRQRLLDALPFLGVLGDDRDLAIGVDLDERIGDERIALGDAGGVGVVR